MSARSLPLNLKPDALMRYETGPLVFQKMAPPALLATRSRSDSLRVALIGNHLPDSVELRPLRQICVMLLRLPTELLGRWCSR